MKLISSTLDASESELAIDGSSLGEASESIMTLDSSPFDASESASDVGLSAGPTIEEAVESNIAQMLMTWHR